MTPIGLQLRDAAVVITGGGSGIGAALARRFAAEGARVVVNDLDPVAASNVADEVGGVAFPGDAANPVDIERMVEFTWNRLDGLDLFCANAGVAPPAPAASDQAWDLAWRVNVMAHVHAARALLPRWLADGQGRFLATVSAAGLLTMLGNAPYSVTKHAAIGFAEWLRATYDHRGITVQALCPQGVQTPMLSQAGAAGSALLGAEAITPEQVAETVLEAIADDRFLILPHPEVARYYARRAGDPDRWLAGMSRVQRELEESGLAGEPEPRATPRAMVDVR